ncbi:hypothetical protein OLZ32_27960 [Rhizobium sp. 1AS11]|uniref:hypothetical protein n=1 Tax=Rhizobium acaciae TaxID=2989736 RepID=UPI002223251D|nr:hypothetical protein [Rhizobium acaciae]MCW1412189.1 hypothetical protein [Rhizobium acaciae]MCW1744204.1 hypothetical protein [Rhizobium acaciae]
MTEPKWTPDRQREATENWKKDHPESVKQHHRTYYEKNREKRIAQTRAFQAANPEKVKEYNKRANAKRRKGGED